MKRKLQLNRETLRQLETGTMTGVQGGASNGQPICFQTLITCNILQCPTNVQPTCIRQICEIL